MEILMYFVLLIVVTGIVVGTLYLTKKYKIEITEEDLDTVGLVLALVDYVNSKFEYRYKGSITEIMEYVKIAFDMVHEVTEINRETSDDSYFIVKDLIFEKTKELLLLNEVEVDDALEVILDSAVAKAIEYYYADK